MSAALGSQVKPFEAATASAPAARPRFGSWWLQLDPLLLLATLALIGFGSYVVGNATHGDLPGNPDYYLSRQIAYGVVGLVLMLLLARFDYSRLREWKLGIYGATIGLILMTLALGTATRGSKRWIDLPFFKLQSSDLGSGMVYIAIACAILFVAGTKWTHFLAIGSITAAIVVVVLVGAPAGGVHVLKQYQVDRLTAFVNPTDDPRRQGYQLRQSTVAIGAGQKTGRGPEHATQTKLDFLPEHHTDFVFSVVGEEFGFAGAAFVLSLYALLIWRALRILTMAKNLYGALIAGGVVAMLMFQIFVNVGMTIGIMPITGVPLPLLSYGGSSVLVTFLAIGLLRSIHVQARASAAAKRRELIA